MAAARTRQSTSAGPPSAANDGPAAITCVPWSVTRATAVTVAAVARGSPPGTTTAGRPAARAVATAAMVPGSPSVSSTPSPGTGAGRVSGSPPFAWGEGAGPVVAASLVADELVGAVLGGGRGAGARGRGRVGGTRGGGLVAGGLGVAGPGPRSVGWSRSSPATAVTASAASTAVGGPLSPARPTRPSGGAMVSLGTCGGRRSTSRPSAPVTTSTAVGCRRCSSASHGGSSAGEVVALGPAVVVALGVPVAVRGRRPARPVGRAAAARRPRPPQTPPRPGRRRRRTARAPPPAR